jgi:hypothetical protein
MEPCLFFTLGHDALSCAAKAKLPEAIQRRRVLVRVRWLGSHAPLPTRKSVLLQGEAHIVQPELCFAPLAAEQRHDELAQFGTDVCAHAERWAGCHDPDLGCRWYFQMADASP